MDPDVASPVSGLMQAIVQDRFGPPDVLRVAEVARPEIGPGDVLVQVHAAALNPYDWHVLRGDPLIARLSAEVGFTRPKARVAGIDAAGRVAAVGAAVRGLRPGDQVFGFCPGAFAEYARTSADLLVPMPARLTFEQAAALPVAATTALRAVRDVGQVRAGQRVLVNGAAGGVGTCAVQLAVALGAEVTGVCGSGNVDLVRSIGATHVLDHAERDFTDGPDRYDVIVDNVGNRPLRRVRRALTPTGTLVFNGGGSPGRLVGAVGRILAVVALDGLVRQRLRPLLAARRPADLLAVAELVESGRLTPVVGRTYPLARAAEGLRHLETGHARGKLVVTIR